MGLGFLAKKISEESDTRHSPPSSSSEQLGMQSKNIKLPFTGAGANKDTRIEAHEKRSRTGCTVNIAGTKSAPRMHW
jgi:hypothetical protein